MSNNKEKMFYTPPSDEEEDDLLEFTSNIYQPSAPSLTVESGQQNTSKNTQYYYTGARRKTNQKNNGFGGAKHLNFIRAKAQSSKSGVNDAQTNVGDGGDEPEADGPSVSQRRIRESDVNMPTGLVVHVTIPAKTCPCTGQCTFDVRLTPLVPGGTMGGREFQIVANQMSKTIRQHGTPQRAGGQFTSYNIVSIAKIQNCCLWKKFRAIEKIIYRDTQNCYVNEKMLFHGSNAADSIVKTGFDKAYANARSMFGPAIYFSNISSKCNQYVYGHMGGNGCTEHADKNCFVCERKMLLCRVALGKEYRQRAANKMSQFPPGFHSVYGEPSPGGLRYPEYAIQKGDQAYPEYLITYKIVQ